MGSAFLSPLSQSAACARLKRQAWVIIDESGIETDCPGPFQVRSAPARRGPDSKLRSGAGPGQVRSGRVERRRAPGSCQESRVGSGRPTETALKSRAVKDPVSLLFAPTIGGSWHPPDAQPTFFLGRLLFPLIFDHLRRPSCLLVGLHFFPSFLSQKTRQSTVINQHFSLSPS